MALVTDYATLQTHIADLLNRTDITEQIKVFIQSAEARFKRDHRVRNLQDSGTLSISADGTTLPADLQAIESWYHDGDSFRGPITIVSSDMIGQLKRTHGSTGAPAFAANVNGKARYAPEPDATFLTKFIYWQTVSTLSDSNTTNWLLDDHPDIYIYGTAIESAPFLKDDPRIQLWKTELNERLEELHKANENEQFSGTLQRQFRSIG